MWYARVLSSSPAIDASAVISYRSCFSMICITVSRWFNSALSIFRAAGPSFVPHSWLMDTRSFA